MLADMRTVYRSGVCCCMCCSCCTRLTAVPRVRPDGDPTAPEHGHRGSPDHGGRGETGGQGEVHHGQSTTQGLLFKIVSALQLLICCVSLPVGCPCVVGNAMLREPQAKPVL